MKNNIKKYIVLLLTLFILSSCSSQKEVNIEKDIADKAFNSTLDLKGINKDKRADEEQGKRIVMNSVALAQLADELELKLAGVPSTNSGKLPQNYNHVYRIGLPMNPDMEVLKSINPTMVYIPDSLADWLDEGLLKHNIPHKYVNLRSVDSLYNITEEFATQYNKKDKYEKLIDEKNKFFEDYNNRISDKKKPKVLVLMGLPSSYVVATENSYVGNLVKLSGAENIVKSDKEFEQVNMEYLLSQNPDYILRAAHALPDVVMKMFEDEFENNKVWNQFSAKQNNKVIDLDYNIFGMTAQFNYTQGLIKLEEIFYK
ncbi:heme ABC transporter substrate-binding protein IsdE [Gemella sp. GH3]|uniref:heme ABC transporter substrate-binding protein IsdE n=1 Tax=unclassified Gemella TaxID=2624949 RepID=UPI0015D048B7|nr:MULTISPECIES: heme ABC transporter substrate-binding protein IsdE [unclassified Gemella]MBF0713968.1 heme ABC transporter substrate-binding protein IsdE [Gemella sp. GH3.1]NYS50920.1 heme ABC transporter substrate-binding protein IsdE [Gemella sp. GH3]